MLVFARMHKLLIRRGQYSNDSSLGLSNKHCKFTCKQKNMTKVLTTILLFFVLAGTSAFAQNYLAPKANVAPSIDGLANESFWQEATWAPIDQLWVGAAVDAADFSGKYKLSWNADKLFILVEVTDNVLFDNYSDPLQHWWDDDCVEVFVDENHSGGNHQYNYNAFAYHVSTLYDAVDLGVDQNPHLYNDHFSVKRTKNGNVYTWEMALTLYTDAFVFGAQSNSVANLVANKLLGFSLAYCDNDGGGTRESFIGSRVVAPADKDRSWIDASVFGGVELIESTVNIIEINSLPNGNVLYPNPSNGQLNFKTDANSALESIEIVNSSGHVIANYSGDTLIANSIDVGFLPTGVYFVKFQNAGASTYKMLMKNE